MSKISKKLLLLLLIAALAATLTFSVVACNKGGDPVSSESWYLSLSSSDYPTYDNVSSVPDAVAMKEEGGVWSATAYLPQNEQFFIKSTAGKSVGYDALFSTAPQLVAGDDGAIKVAASGTFAFSYDGEYLTYSYTPPAAAPLTGITLDKTSLALENGATTTLSASFVPDDAVPVGLIWTSADQNVATVTQDGVVTAVGYGTTTITVTTATGGFSAQCTVTVVRHATGLSLSATNIEIAANGLPKTVEVNFYPDDATEHEYTASITQGAEFAELSDDGEGKISVYGKAEGTAILSVSLVSDPESVAECAITILPEGNPIVHLDKYSVRTMINEDITIHASLENGEVQNIEWVNMGHNFGDRSNKYSELAKLTTSKEDPYTATVTGKNFGYVNIKVNIYYSKRNFVTAYCRVTVADDFFFIYGYNLGSKDWDWEPYIGDREAARRDNLAFEEYEPGKYTLTRHLTPEQGFQIIFPKVASFVNVNDQWIKNIPSSASEGASFYYYGAVSDRDYVTNGTDFFRVNTPGVYTVTLDLTYGASESWTNGMYCSVILNMITLDVEDVNIMPEEDCIINSGETSTFDFSWPHEESVVTEDMVKAELISDYAGANDLVSFSLDPETRRISVTAGTIPQAFTATLRLTVDDATGGSVGNIELYFMPSGGAVSPVTSIEFEQDHYYVNVNQGGASDAWQQTVKATVNFDATDKQVRYYDVTNYNEIKVQKRATFADVDPVSGLVIGKTLGTITVQAVAMGDKSKTATCEVTFYSDQIYLVGTIVVNSGWNALGQGVTSTESTPFENYTFTQESLTRYSLRFTAKKEQQFQIAYCGMAQDWLNVIHYSQLTTTLGNARGSNNDYYTDLPVGTSIKVWTDNTFIIHLDLSRHFALWSLDVEGREERTFGLYKDSASSATSSSMNPGDTLEYVLFNFDKSLVIPENELTITATDNEDGYFSWTYDPAKCRLTVTCLKQELLENKSVQLSITYKGFTSKISFTVVAEHTLVRKHDDANHWYACSKPGCDYETEHLPHVSTGEWEQDRVAHEHYLRCSECNYTYDRGTHTFEGSLPNVIDLTTGTDSLPACTTCGEKLVTIINDRLLGYYGKANKIILPDTLTEIGAHIFDGHTELRSINWPSSLKTIGDYAFYGCTGIPAFTMPASVESVGQHAFDGCPIKITFLTSGKLGSVGAYAFAGTKITSLYIGRTDDFKMGEGAFYGCDELHDVTIGALKFETIPAYAFYGCSSLEWVYIRDNNNGNNLFRDDWWTSIYFWQFCDSAFGGCASLEAIYIEKDAQYWCGTISGKIDPTLSWLGDCSALEGKVYVYTEDGDKEYNFDEDHAPYIAGTWHYAGNVRKFSRIVLWD